MFIIILILIFTTWFYSALNYNSINLNRVTDSNCKSAFQQNISLNIPFLQLRACVDSPCELQEILRKNNFRLHITSIESVLICALYTFGIHHLLIREFKVPSILFQLIQMQFISRQKIYKQPLDNSVVE